MNYTVRELEPNYVNQKSFYGKAKVVSDDKYEILFSYNTPIMVRVKEWDFLYRWWEGGYTYNRPMWGMIVPDQRDWSPTTAKHIKEFSGLYKKEYFELMSVEDLPEECWKEIVNLTDEYMATLK